MHTRLDLRRQLAWLAVLLGFVVYVGNAWTPSHGGQIGTVLAVPRAGPAFGEVKPIRSDDWAVATPYYQIAVANDLGPRNELSPYREPLKAFFALPSRDWSMLFKPDLWGFLALDPAYAFSLHFALLAAAMLAGFAILLRQLGCSAGYAVAISAALFCSQFVQAWWTSNAAVLALAPWPFVVWLWPAPWVLRAPAAAYAVACWLIGMLYPPFIIGAGLAMFVAVAAFRPEALRPGRAWPVLAGGLAGLGAAWLHYADLIPVMAATVYPGARLSSGGGTPLLQLAAHVFPSLVTARYEPVAPWPSNACEIAVVGTWLPLAMACFCDAGSLARLAVARRAGVLTWLTGLAVMVLWMAAPIPAAWAPLLNLTPPGRLLWGFGLLLVLGLAVLGAEARWRFTWIRLAVFTALIVAAWVFSKVLRTDTPLALGRFDLVAPPLIVMLYLAGRALRRAIPARRLLVAVVALSAALTFGRFNPVQSAWPLFHSPPSPVVAALDAYAAANPRGWAVEARHYGAVLAGAGVPSVAHVLLQPQLPVFRRAYPGLDDATFNEVFNRYGHIVPQVRWTPALLSPDAIAIPPDPFAIPLPVDLGGAPGAGAVEAFRVAEVRRLGPDTFGVAVEGWARWRGVRPGQSLSVGLDPGAGRIVSAAAYRLARPDVVISRRDPQAFAAGFGLRLVIRAPAAAPGPTGRDLRLAFADVAAPAAALRGAPEGRTSLAATGGRP